jgi:hypothetical protein
VPTWKRPDNSAARCCASAAEPPLPQNITLPPARIAAIRTWPAAAMSGASVRSLAKPAAIVSISAQISVSSATGLF